MLDNITRNLQKNRGIVLNHKIGTNEAGELLKAKKKIKEEKSESLFPQLEKSYDEEEKKEEKNPAEEGVKKEANNEKKRDMKKACKKHMKKSFVDSVNNLHEILGKSK